MSLPDDTNVQQQAQAYSRDLKIASAICALFLLLGGWCWLKIPMEMDIFAVPITLVSLGLMAPLLFWQTHSKHRRKICGISSCVLWVASIPFAFLIPPSSPFIPVPDLLLLLGFLPLLFAWRFSWPWIVFGLFNLSIGFFLLLIRTIPDSSFPVELHKGKHHIAEYHNQIAWMIIGLITFIFGLVRMTKNIVNWMRRKRNDASA